ncbi:MAG: beta/gamma crystallin family protein [Candidatus Aminicenantes bacterium]|nr:MAG: beta/gamma crystallin family protein [Candidatus Aminicenantes bacterium]
MRVFGRIEDAYTEELLPGAIVSLKVGDTELIEHTPAKDGNFDYEIPDQVIPIDEDVLTCIIEKQGYRTQTSTYTITDEIELAVELIPHLVNWKRIFTVIGIILGSLLMLAIIIFGIKYFFFGPKEYPIKTFTVKPGKIKAGEQAEIKWETIDADVVFLGDKKVKDDDKVELTGTQTVSPAKTRKYFLTVKDDDGKQVAREWRELKVIPPPPVILSFTAKPLEINLWESAVLEWKTVGAETIYIRSDPENENFRIDPHKIQRKRSIIDEDYPETEKAEPAKDKKELNGSMEVFPLETTKFTLVAVNSVGVKQEESIELKVLAAPEIISFTASTRTIDPGESVILDWKTRGAEQVFLDDGGKDPWRTGPNYSHEVRPKETTTYKLTARNKVGDRHSIIKITVRTPELPEPDPPPPLKPPRIQRFHISAPVIAPGESTVLTWVTDYAEKVYLTIKPVDVDLNVQSADTTAAANENSEIIAGKPLETGVVMRVKPVDSMRVSPNVSTHYQLRAINSLKEVSWTRTVEVKSITCTIILYELENYRGDYMLFTTDAAKIYEMDNRVSSIKIIGNCGVKVFSAPNFKATHQEFLESVPRLRGTWIGNNTISSLKIINYPGAKK